jgi:CheY-like chemotaxis protein
MTLRCLIVDDNSGFGAAATDVLEGEGIVVVGVATSGDDAIAKVKTLHPELALVDVNLGEESGFDVAQRLAAIKDGPRVILISTQDGQDFEARIEASPALGFLAKTDLSATAIHRVLASSG